MQISWHPSCCSMTHQKHSPLSQRCDIFLKVTYKFPCFVLLAVENLLRPVQLISSEYWCVYSFSCVAPKNSPGHNKYAQFYLKTLSHLLAASTSCSKAPLVPTFEVKLCWLGSRLKPPAAVLRSNWSVGSRAGVLRSHWPLMTHTHIAWVVRLYKS